MEEQTPALSRTMQEGFMTCILDIGEMLLKNGAEIMRVEDTLFRLCKSCGFSSAEVFSIPSCNNTDGPAPPAGPPSPRPGGSAPGAPIWTWFPGQTTFQGRYAPAPRL